MVILTPITINNHFNNANYVTKVDHLCSERHTFNFLLKKVDFRDLKRLSRDCKIPVVVISSFNRENYGSKVSMQAFKESGAIEYSTDVLIGLQLKGTGEKGFDIDDAKAKNPREIEAVILKNRNGAAGKKIFYKYYTMFNYFREI